jgi:hypothetical protein
MKWIHPDADHEDHECAVTLFSGGGCLPVSNPPPVIEAPSYTFLFTAPVEPAEMLVQIFMGQQIAERGPPLIGNNRYRS